MIAAGLGWMLCLVTQPPSNPLRALLFNLPLVGFLAPAGLLLLGALAAVAWYGWLQPASSQVWPEDVETEERAAPPPPARNP